MTMLWLDDVPVVFDGTARIEWVHVRPWHRLAGSDEAADLPPAVVHGVWPDVATRAMLLRRISQLGRTLVVFDLERLELTVARHRIPRLPAGAIAADRPDGSVALAVRPIDWLGEGDRARGLSFLARARASTRLVDALDSPVIVEHELVGGPVPLRFVCHRGPLCIDQLRRVVQQVFAGTARPAAGGSDHGRPRTGELLPRHAA